MKRRSFFAAVGAFLAASFGCLKPKADKTLLRGGQGSGKSLHSFAGITTRFTVGETITFVEEPTTPYTVQAVDSRFAVLTRPTTQDDAEEWDDAIMGEVIYTIVDSQTWERGPNNMVFNAYEYKRREECERCVDDLSSPNNWLTLSSRHSIPVRLLEHAFWAPPENVGPLAGDGWNDLDRLFAKMLAEQEKLT
jgi:hypothetical protein